MNRSTLDEQIAISKLTEEDCIRALIPHSVLGRSDFWLHNHLVLVWRFIHWNWFNIFSGERSFFKFAKHGFREWRG